MAEQDRKDLVPSVLNDLIDVDGEPTVGQMLRFDGEAWRPRTDGPLRFKTGNIAVAAGHNADAYLAPLSLDTDVYPGTADASGDVVFAEGTIEFYTLGKQCLKVVNSGTYALTWNGSAGVPEADDGELATLEVYLSLNDESFGPTYWAVPKQRIQAVWPTNASVRVLGAINLYLQAGDELIALVNYRAPSDATNLNVLGDIYRMS